MKGCGSSRYGVYIAGEGGEIFRVHQGVVPFFSHRSFCCAHPLPIPISLQMVGGALDKEVLLFHGSCWWFCRLPVWWDFSIICYMFVASERRVAPPCIKQRATVSVKVIEGGRGAARTVVGRCSSDGMLRERYRRATCWAYCVVRRASRCSTACYEIISLCPISFI
jgi:hypothetical protein